MTRRIRGSGHIRAKTYGSKPEIMAEIVGFGTISGVIFAINRQTNGHSLLI